jgi:phosphoribosylanthranilate isomerase
LRTRIKLCGLTNLSDALYAASLGIDALGFIFAESPRRVSPETARDIILHLPPFITTVGVFVDEDERKVKEIASTCGLNTLQFHGSESPSYCLNFRQNVIKAFRLKVPLDPVREIEKIKTYQKVAKGLLLDILEEATQSPDWQGGQIALMAKPLGQIILAGGLNPGNIALAIRKVKPYAVDVSSGVEISPGVKDHKKMKQLVEEIERSR